MPRLLHKWDSGWEWEWGWEEEEEEEIEFRKAAAGAPGLGGGRPYVAIPGFGGGLGRCGARARERACDE